MHFIFKDGAVVEGYASLGVLMPSRGDDVRFIEESIMRSGIPHPSGPPACQMGTISKTIQGYFTFNSNTASAAKMSMPKAPPLMKCA